MGLALGGIVMDRVADHTTTRRVCLVGAVILGLCILASAHALLKINTVRRAIEYERSLAIGFQERNLA